VQAVPKILKRSATSKSDITAINTHLTELSATLDGVRRAAEEQLTALLAMRSLSDTHETMIRDQQLVLDTICTTILAIENGVANIGATLTLSADRFARIYAAIKMWLARGDNWRVKGEEWWEQGKELFEQRKIVLQVGS
jgi:hypothetical protein